MEKSQALSVTSDRPSIASNYYQRMVGDGVTYRTEPTTRERKVRLTVPESIAR